MTQLYTHQGEGPIDVHQWTRADVTKPNGTPLYTFEGDVEEGDKNGSERGVWAAYNGSTVPVETPSGDGAAPPSPDEQRPADAHGDMADTPPNPDAKAQAGIYAGPADDSGAVADGATPADNAGAPRPATDGATTDVPRVPDMGEAVAGTATSTDGTPTASGIDGPRNATVPDPTYDTPSHLVAETIAAAATPTDPTASGGTVPGSGPNGPELTTPVALVSEPQMHAVVEGSEVKVTGTAKRAARVQVYVDDDDQGHTAEVVDGYWELTFDDLQEGPHRVAPLPVAEDGEQGPMGTAHDFTVAEVPPAYQPDPDDPDQRLAKRIRDLRTVGREGSWTAIQQRHAAEDEWLEAKGL